MSVLEKIEVKSEEEDEEDDDDDEERLAYEGFGNSVPKIKFCSIF